MARKPEIRYREKTATRPAGYYTQYKGKQYKLSVGPDDASSGPTYLAALDRFKSILSLDTLLDKRDDNSVEIVCMLYLEWIDPDKGRGAVAPATYKMKQYFLKHFSQEFGKKPVRSLTYQDVYAYCDHLRKTGIRSTPWADGTERMLLQTLGACFNWAAKPAGGNLISKNPLAGIKSPPARSRGAESIIEPAEHQLILATCSKSFRDFIICLEDTGCRPTELRMAEAKNWDDARGCLVYRKVETLGDGHRHKNARKGQDRLIFFTGTALAVIRDLVAAHPTGKLFRPRPKKGGRQMWTKKKVCQQFAQIRARLGLARPLTAYSYRHTFATAWLKRNPNCDQLAVLMGNSPAVIRRHYSHLLHDDKDLRAALEDVKRRVSSAVPDQFEK